MDAEERLHCWLQGRVQGVGFRAFVLAEARRLNLVGWVRNVGYDTVEVVAEGTRPVLERFYAQIKKGPRAARVDEDLQRWETATGEFKSFRVRMSV